MKTVLITGGGGYIGSNAVYLFLQKGYKVVAVDNFNNGYRGPLELMQSKYDTSIFRFYEHDLKEDISPIFRKEKNIDVVIHYAAYCNVFESTIKPEKYFDNNIRGCLNVLDAMTQAGLHKFIFSSTCAVYGESQYVPLDENHPTLPVNPYGESKLMAETIIDWYGKLKNLNYVILRYFNVCGASDDGLFGDSKRPSFGLMQNAIRAACGLDEFQLVCPKVDTPDGTPIRDYVNVVDLNEAHVAAFEYLVNGGPSDILNIGTNEGNSVIEIVNAVKDITGTEFKIENGEVRMGDPAKLYASNEKVKRILDWSPKRSVRDSVESLRKWYTDRPEGWIK